MDSLSPRTLFIDVMYAMDTAVTFVSSVLGTFGIVLTHEFMFYDTANMLVAFLMLGRYLECWVKGRTSDEIKKLAGLWDKQRSLSTTGWNRRMVSKTWLSETKCS